jgi:hypothetical protein
MYCALKAARADLWQYEMGLYPAWFLAKLLVHWRMQQLVMTHAEDARARKAAQEAK